MIAFKELFSTKTLNAINRGLVVFKTMIRLETVHFDVCLVIDLAFSSNCTFLFFETVPVTCRPNEPDYILVHESFPSMSRAYAVNKQI